MKMKFVWPRCWALLRDFSFIALVCTSACWSLQANAQPSGTAPRAAGKDGPILRIDAGAHTATVRAAAFDAAKERVYTASDDKTVRVWQLPEGKLLQTFRVPILDGAEGQLYAMSLSNDGRWLAVGGWTGWDWEQKASVYIFDTQTERLVQRLPVAAWTITSMRFSPDGEYLAVGMHGQGGLVIVRRANGQVVSADTAYQNKVMDMEFDRYGRLYTIGLDGFVRLYKQDFSMLARRAAKASKDPVGLRVSPDGEHVAIAFGDAPVVEVMNTRDLSTALVLKGPANTQKDFVSVGWSSDKQFIYAAGEGVGTAENMYRWNVTGSTEKGASPSLVVSPAPQAIRVTTSRINDLWPLSKGRMLFITDAPSVGWVDASGKVNQPIVSTQWDFAAAGASLAISSDANTVGWTAGGKSALFDVNQTRLQAQPAGGNLQRALTQAPGWRLSIGPDLRSLNLNGVVVPLEEYEKVRSHAFAPNRSSVVVGTEWALRSYNPKGELQWLVRVSSQVWGVNVSADGRTVVAATGDGTVRWFSSQTGQELLSLFVHQASNEWIAWVPGGYYTSSPYGDKYIGWHINRGLDVEPDFVYAVQLERVLYKPNLVRTALGGGAGLSKQAATPASPAPRMTAAQMVQMAPPRVRVRLVSVDAAKATARLSVEAEQTGPQMQDIAVYVNDIPVTPASERVLRQSESKQLKREFEVPLSRKVNDIRVEAFAGVSMGLGRTQADLPENAPISREQGNLYVLAIGASQFDLLPDKMWLAYAAKDANTLAEYMGSEQNMPFKNRYVKVVSDTTGDKPTRSNIVQSLDFLKSATANDTVILFLASHAVSNAQGNYFFVPKDVLAKDLQGTVAVDNPQTLLSWQVFFDALRVVAGRRVLIVDTCQAKGIAGKIDPNALIKRSASSMFALMLASADNEESQEYDPAGHGLFTFGLLSALREAQSQKTGGLNLRDWFTGSARVVQRFRDRSIGPQTPQLLSPAALEQTAFLVKP